jgi:transposase
VSVEFVGGPEQAEFMGRVQGLDPGRVLLVPVDVGKWEAMAMVTDLRGEIITAPFKFPLTASGVTVMRERASVAVNGRDAAVCRVGVEAAGHYHRPLVNRLVADRVEVVELNPAAVKHARAQQLRARTKTDQRDLAAIADLMARGAGRPPQQRGEAIVEQAAWVSHRARKVETYRRLRQQIHAQLDLVFPGLTACFSDLFDSRCGLMILTELCSPERVSRLGATRLISYGRTRGIRITTTKAERVVAAARDALALPGPQRASAEAILAADVALFSSLRAELDRCEARLEEILPNTPAGVLTSLPGIGIVRASAYGAALGDHTRFPNAAAAYAFAGLTPASYESAGRSRPGLGITRTGSVTLRQAILELGRGLGFHQPDFAEYRAQLLARNKPPRIAALLTVMWVRLRPERVGVRVAA